MFKYSKEEIQKITKTNMDAWNEVMPLHQLAAKSKLDKEFSKKGFSVIPENELMELNNIGFHAKNIIHLACNNGIELLSLKNLGAGTCLGVDISEEAIKEAKERADKCNIAVDFIQSDVYELSEYFNNQFDIVYFTIGALCWMPDLEKLWMTANRLLKENGIIFIHELHPFALIFAGDENKENPLQIKYPYFTSEPEIYNDSLDYVGKSKEKGKTKINFTHTVSDIIQSLLLCNFKIINFMEYPTDISTIFTSIERLKLSLPLSFIMIAQKS